MKYKKSGCELLEQAKKKQRTSEKVTFDTKTGESFDQSSAMREIPIKNTHSKKSLARLIDAFELNLIDCLESHGHLMNDSLISQ